MDASTQATRCLERLFRKHAQEFQALDEFQTADRSFCPELWDAQQTEPLFHSTPNEIGDRLLLAVARAFRLNPTALDDAMMAREWGQHHQQVAQALCSVLQHSTASPNTHQESEMKNTYARAAFARTGMRMTQQTQPSRDFYERVRHHICGRYRAAHGQKPISAHYAGHQITLS